MRDVGDEVAPDRFQPPQPSDVIQHEQGPAVRERSRGYEDGSVPEIELTSLEDSAGQHLTHQRPVRAIVE